MTATQLAPAAPYTQGAARPVGLYGRISKRKGGDGKGAYVKISDQHQDTWARMADHFPGAAPVTYQDNLSAWDPDVVRPDWERFLEDVWAGRFQAVGAWASDRYTRQPRQLEELWAACQATGTQLWTLHSGHVSSALMLRIEGAIAAEESDLKSGRIRMRHASKAAQGEFHGGKRRYGYTPGMDELVPHEAAVIRDLAARILAGSTLASLARELNERGEPTALSTPDNPVRWTGPNLSVMLRRPHLAGLRTHTPKGTDQATLVDAAWPAVLDRSTWERLQLVLGKPDRKANQTGNARVYLLAGLATCATCGAVLRGRPEYDRKGNGVRKTAYQCRTGRHCYRPVEDVDAVVERRVVRRLSRMTAAGHLVLDGQPDELDALAAERDGLQARLAEYADAAATMSPAAYAAATASLEKELARVQAELVRVEASKARPLAVLEGMTGPGAPEAWAQADLGRRRAVLALLGTYALRGAATRRAPFTPDDVVVTWKIGKGLD